MTLAHLSPLGLVLAVLAGFLVGFLWFGPKSFFPIWWRAIGKGDARPGEGMNMVAVFGATLAALVVEALVIAAVVGGIHGAEAGPLDGLVVGALLGLGLAAMPSLGHRLFSGQGWLVWVLEVGADVVTAATVGLVVASV